MSDKENSTSRRKSDRPDPAEGGLGESSLSQSPALPGGPAAKDDGRRKIPGNDQREGLEKAEAAGKSPGKP